MKIQLGSWLVFEVAFGGVYVRVGSRDLHWSREEGVVR